MSTLDYAPLMVLRYMFENWKLKERPDGSYTLRSPENTRDRKVYPRTFMVLLREGLIESRGNSEYRLTDPGRLVASGKRTWAGAYIIDLLEHGNGGIHGTTILDRLPIAEAIKTHPRQYGVITKEWGFWPVISNTLDPENPLYRWDDDIEAWEPA